MINFENELNEAQLAPVTDTEGAVLVLAGAGSGKTRVLTYRIAYLIEHNHVDPYNILAITFTNKATKEMRERLDNMVGDCGIWISTFHSMCARILREFGERIGYNSKFSIYTEVDTDRLIKRIISEKHIEDKNFGKTVAFHIGEAKKLALSPDEYERYKGDGEADIELICSIYRKYETELKENNCMDFDDLLLKTCELFVNNSDVLSKYQERFKYIHIDEFQDTNRIQFLLAKLLSKKHGNIFVVGDDDQSIYSWRGADVGNILDFNKEYPCAKVYKLEQNYRSTTPILEVANKIIKNNSLRHPKELWTDKKDGVRVEIKDNYSDRAEAEYVVSTIDNLIRNKGYKPRDCAILCRLNALTRVFEDYLNVYRIPYKVFGGFKFYERKEIKDVTAYLKVVNNPRDTDSLLRIINTPKRGIGDTAVERMLAYCEDNDMRLIDFVLGIDTVDGMPAPLVNKVKDFRDLLSDLIQNADNMNFEDYVKYAVDKIGFKQAYSSGSEEDKNRLLNIQEFIEATSEYAAQLPDATLSDFLEGISLMSDADEADESDYVTISTIHMVKGLEFKVVFVVGLEEGIFPAAKSKDDKKELEEERRVLYVAVTRAEERLYLTYAGSRFRFSHMENYSPSRFIGEILGIKQNTYSEDNGRRSLGGYQPKIATSHIVADEKHTEMKNYTDYVLGAKVRHPKFGDGTIIAVAGTGESKTVQVAFAGAGIKNLSLAAAPLELIR